MNKTQNQLLSGTFHTKTIKPNPVCFKQKVNLNSTRTNQTHCIKRQVSIKNISLRVSVKEGATEYLNNTCHRKLFPRKDCL